MSDDMNPDNPPAFPGDPLMSDRPYAPGMSLRDYFAGQALSGYLAANPEREVGTTSAATRSYAYADAMLAERAR